MHKGVYWCAGLLEKPSGDAAARPTPMEHLGGQQRALARRLQREAALAWWRPGHPGWSLWSPDAGVLFAHTVQARLLKLGCDVSTLTLGAHCLPGGQEAHWSWSGVEALRPPGNPVSKTESVTQTHQSSTCTVPFRQTLDF